MAEVKITEDRYLQLIDREKEAVELMEGIILDLVKRWARYNKKRFGWQEDKTEVAKYVNKALLKRRVQFNGVVTNVWFNSMGSGSMMYWSYGDSKVLHGVDNIIRKPV